MTAVDTFTNVMRGLSFGIAVGFVALVFETTRYWWTNHRKRPVDWQKDFPEYRIPKAGHVERIWNWGPRRRFW
jgi:hypothetical protein